jgi:negative regulator of genetic competence, sporulation and motility
LLNHPQTKQNKAEQNKTKQNKTKQNKTKQNKTEQRRAEQSRAEQSRAEQNKTMPNKTKQYIQFTTFCDYLIYTRNSRGPTIKCRTRLFTHQLNFSDNYCKIYHGYNNSLAQLGLTQC